MNAHNPLSRAAAALVAACSLVALASCAKEASDKELAQAYTFYIEAPRTLKKVVSTANTDKFVAESISNPEGTYIRATEIDQAAKTSKITATFKGFHPVDAETVTMDGEVVMTSLGRVFSINGTLTYRGIRPKTLTFNNASLEQGRTDDGNVSFRPVSGTVVADKRSIPVDVFFNEILQ